MTTSVFKIPNISCGHCVNAIKSELSEMEGVVSISGDPLSRQIEVKWNAPASMESIKTLLKEINYPAAE